MEQIYLKGNQKTWHSINLDLLKHFTQYGKVYEKITKNEKLSVNAIMKRLYHNISFDPKDFVTLAQLTHEDQLKPFINISLKTERNLNKTLRSSYLSTNKNVRKSVSGKKKKKSTTLKVPNFQVTNENIDSNCNTNQHEKNCENTINNSSAKSNYRKNKYQIQCGEPNSDSQNIPLQPQEENLHHHIFENCPNIQGKKKCSNFKDNFLMKNSELLVEPDLTLPKNLKKGKHFIVSFRIHEPYSSYTKCKVGHFMQEICVLDFQSLDCLRDKIICQWDFQDSGGEASDIPGTPVTQLTKDTCSSAMFYIGNTFYVDFRYKENIDYSVVIKQWANERGIPLGKTVDMRTTPVGSLNVRFGYPYVYMHQGSCEHLVIINDARLVTGKDPLSYQNYPMISKIPRHTIKNCMVCSSDSTRWIVTESDRMLYDFTYLCQSCFQRFYYINGKKIGTFKAYRYQPVAAIL